MGELDKLHSEYMDAKQRWLVAERAFAVASAELNAAARARKVEWDKLVAAAETLPDEVRKRVASAEFAPDSTSQGRK